VGFLVWNQTPPRSSPVRPGLFIFAAKFQERLSFVSLYGFLRCWGSSGHTPMSSTKSAVILSGLVLAVALTMAWVSSSATSS
jgi:hypothetical protein